MTHDLWINGIEDMTGNMLDDDTEDPAPRHTDDAPTSSVLPGSAVVWEVIFVFRRPPDMAYKVEARTKTEAIAKAGRYVRIEAPNETIKRTRAIRRGDDDTQA